MVDGTIPERTSLHHHPFGHVGYGIEVFPSELTLLSSRCCDSAYAERGVWIHNVCILTSPLL